MITKTTLLIAALTVPVFLSGCNTAKGFGMDLEDLGLVIQGKNASNLRTDAPSTTSSVSTPSKTYSSTSSSVPITSGTVVDQQVQYSTGSGTSTGTQVYTYPYTESGTTTVQPSGSTVGGTINYQ